MSSALAVKANTLFVLATNWRMVVEPASFGVGLCRPGSALTAQVGACRTHAAGLHTATSTALVYAMSPRPGGRGKRLARRVRDSV